MWFFSRERYWPSSRWSPHAIDLHPKRSREPTVELVVRETGPTARGLVGYIGSLLLLRRKVGMFDARSFKTLIIAIGQPSF